MSSQELTSVPDPHGDTKPSFRSRTSSPRPRRGDPIAKVGNPSGEEKPQELAYQEPEGVKGSQEAKENSSYLEVCAYWEGQ